MPIFFDCQQVEDFKRSYTDLGFPVYENPSPGNKEGGITTLEEKSLGCVEKAGHTPIVDVLAYGDPAHRKWRLSHKERAEP